MKQTVKPPSTKSTTRESSTRITSIKSQNDAIEAHAAGSLVEEDVEINTNQGGTKEVHVITVSTAHVSTVTTGHVNTATAAHITTVIAAHDERSTEDAKTVEVITTETG